MNSFSSTNSLVTQLFNSGSDKNAIYHNRFIHPGNIPSAIEVVLNKEATAVVTPSAKIEYALIY